MSVGGLRSLVRASAAAFALSACGDSYESTGPDFAIEEGRWTGYTTATSGLPSDAVLDLAIGPDGTLWIATDNGLARFDGDGWSRFTPQNADLVSAHVSEVAIDADGTVWTVAHTASQELGLSAYDGKRWTRRDPADSGLSAAVVTELAVAPGGAIWLATLDGIAISEGARWRRLEASGSGLPDDRVYSLDFDDDGTAWIATDAGAVRYDGVTWTALDSTNSGLPGRSVGEIHVDGVGRVWFSLSSLWFGWSNLSNLEMFADRVVTLESRTWKGYGFQEGILGSIIADIDSDARDGVWVLDLSAVYRFDGAGFAKIPLPDEGVLGRCLAAGEEDDVWIGTDKGLLRWQP